jgi:hypothetical protein
VLGDIDAAPNILKEAGGRVPEHVKFFIHAGTSARRAREEARKIKPSSPEPKAG